MNNEKMYWVWLSTIPGVGARRFNKLLERFDSPEKVFMAKTGEISKLSPILGEKCTQSIIDNQNSHALDKAADIVESKNITVLTINLPDYPPLLKAIYDPPPVLYLKGQPLRYEAPSIAIVGSRKSSVYGRQAAEKISAQLAEAGVTVVSGLARGIDTMAHRGVIGTTLGYTIAVLGCGVDVIYPSENRSLYHEIEKKGTILSEYPPGTQPSTGNFPARNRIVSGLSQGVLVIEAGDKSGALITVDCALEQGRDVFALPGNINSPFSKGTNKLIKEGAKIITQVEDILEELSIVNVLQTSGAPNRALELDFFETQVYNALEDGQKDMEALIRDTGLETGRLSAVLTMMEIKGIIKQIPGRIFVIQWKG